MDFIRYAESAAALLDAELTDVDALLAHLRTREWLHPTVIDPRRGVAAGLPGPRCDSSSRRPTAGT